jgi:hypothetical protein
MRVRRRVVMRRIMRIMRMMDKRMNGGRTVRDSAAELSEWEAESHYHQHSTLS